MVIKQINLSGFERLYDGYKRSENEKRKAYGSNIFSFLEHCMIGIELDMLTTIELYYLKKFASSVKVLGFEYRNFTSKDKEFDMNQKIDCLMSLHDEMVNDDDINTTESEVDNILPIGCKSYHVFAIFKGASIPSVTGGFVEDIFKENGVCFDEYPEELDMNDRIVTAFYKNFYSYIARKTTDLDLVTEYMTNVKFYQYGDEDVNLAHVNTPMGELVFFGNNSDNLNRQISHIKSAEMKTPFFVKEMTYLTFVLNTTFSTFMKLYLNSDFIIDNEDLKIVFASDNIQLSEPILDKYKARISNSLDYLISNRKGLNHSVDGESGPNLNMLNYIFNGSKIKYSIQLTVDQIERLDTILSEVDEMESIKSKIKSFSETIVGLIG